MNNDFLFMLAAMSLAGAYKLWEVSLAARERANLVARDACSRAVVQFLDDTVAFAGVRLKRDTRGIRLLRTYTFDYTSDGFGRSQGFIVLCGQHVDAVGMAGEQRAPSMDIAK